MITYRMADILPLLGLPEPPQYRRDYYVPCPRCDSEQGKHLNIHLEKDVFRCPRCGIQGGVFDLYALYTDIPRDTVLADLRTRTGNSSVPVQHKPMSAPPAETPCADIAMRDAVYRALLAKLSLAPDHQHNLTNRGLSPEAIARNGYRTTPLVGIKALAKQLLAEGHALQGVPGFFRDNDQWSFVPEQRGILIPVRDVQGRIQGLQVRRDNAEKRKFRWVSSASYPDGCRAEGWTHFVGSPREKIILIEGPLKADVVHHLTGHSVLAVPGVNALTHLEKALLALRELGVRHIMTAFDMDFLSNPHVQSGYDALTQKLMSLGFRYGTYLWNPGYNGLDDYVWEGCRQAGYEQSN
ncbi:MAG: DUF3854 domain-containing protein [Oscillospiraceae bacterium]|nr:DUF3854 domain-containing protein [Oscillospiraceae bacterium]